MSIHEEFASGTFKHAKAEALIMKSLTESLMLSETSCKQRDLRCQFVSYTLTQLTWIVTIMQPCLDKVLVNNHATCKH